MSPHQFGAYYNRHLFRVHLHDPRSAGWYDRDWERLQEIDVLAKSRLRNGSIVFDIGAHQAVVAMMLAKEVGASGRVIAVEPNPFNIHVASLNLASNGFTNHHPHVAQCTNPRRMAQYIIDGNKSIWNRKILTGLRSVGSLSLIRLPRRQTDSK